MSSKEEHLKQIENGEIIPDLTLFKENRARNTESRTYQSLNPKGHFKPLEISRPKRTKPGLSQKKRKKR